MTNILTRTVLIEKSPIEIVIDNYKLQPGDSFNWWYSNYIGHTFFVINCYNIDILNRIRKTNILSLEYEVSEFYVVSDYGSGYEGNIILKRHCTKNKL